MSKSVIKKRNQPPQQTKKQTKIKQNNNKKGNDDLKGKKWTKDRRSIRGVSLTKLINK